MEKVKKKRGRPKKSKENKQLDKNPKNDKNPKGKKGRVATVSHVISEAMFKFFVYGVPLTEMSKKFGVSTMAIMVARDKYNWVKRRLRLQRKIEKASEREISNSIISNKKKRVEALEYLFKFYLENVKTVWQEFNMHPEAGTNPAKFWGLNDIDKLYKLIHFELNDGITKTETIHSDGDQVKEIKKALDSGDKTKLLRVISGGKSIESKD